MLGLHRFKLYRHLVDGIVKSVYSGFGLDGFHCSDNICICDVLVSVLATSAVNREFETQSGLTKGYRIGSVSDVFAAQH